MLQSIAWRISRRNIFSRLFAAAGVSLGGGAPTSRLVIFTDGIHTAAPFNLTATELDDEAISELLDAIAEADLIASLDDVEVTFVGVNMGETSLAPQRLRGIERFWRAYVDASGAKMAGYDTTLPAARR